MAEAKKPAAPKAKPKAEPKPKAAPAQKAEPPKPPSLLEDLRAVRERILAERAQYASPVEGRLTRVANDIEDVASAEWVDVQLKERSR